MKEIKVIENNKTNQIQAKLKELTDNIVSSYSSSDPKAPKTHHLDHCPLPNKQTIVEILEDLIEILYPGYLHRDRLNLTNVVYYVGGLLDSIYEKLTTQISRAFCHGNRSVIDCSPEKRYEYELLGREKATEFLEKIPEIRAALAMDAATAMDGDPACTSVDEVIFCYPGQEAISVYRLAHALYQLNVPLIPRIMTEWAHSRTGIDIHPGAEIGNNFFIDHGTGVVIGETCKIGKGVKLYQGVTLGAKSFSKDEKGKLVRGNKRHPTIEDDVIIYANATILGGETVIGKGAVIGSNVWLTASIKPGTLVTMKKPELEKRENIKEL